MELRTWPKKKVHGAGKILLVRLGHFLCGVGGASGGRGGGRKLLERTNRTNGKKQNSEKLRKEKFGKTEQNECEKQSKVLYLDVFSLLMYRYIDSSKLLL